MKQNSTPSSATITMMNHYEFTSASGVNDTSNYIPSSCIDPFAQNLV